MRGSVHKIGEFEWHGEMVCWADADGNPVSDEKHRELEQQAAALFQQEVMDRLEVARAAFDCMATDQERKAAFEWLRQAYNL